MPSERELWLLALAKASPEDRERIRHYWWTGKAGTHAATGIQSFELESRREAARIWLLEDGRVVAD